MKVKIGQAPPPDPLPSLVEMPSWWTEKASAHRTWESLRDSHIPTRPFRFSEFRTQDAARAAYLCVLRVARFRPRKSAPAFAPLICVGFECNSGLSLSPVPRGPVDTLSLPRSPLRKRADTPHLVGWQDRDLSPCGFYGQPWMREKPQTPKPLGLCDRLHLAR